MASFRRALKEALYVVLAVIFLIFLIFWTQDEETIERIFTSTGLTEKIYNYWDFERYAPELKDVAFWGHMKVDFEGDTSGLGIVPHYYRFYMGERFDEHFNPASEYVNLDNFELLETDKKAAELAKHAKDNQIGTLWFVIKITKLGPFNMPVWYSMVLYAGTVENEQVYHSKYVNMAYRRTLDMGLEHGIDRELKSFAKKFFKIKQNRDQLRELYKSVYMK